MGGGGGGVPLTALCITSTFSSAQAEKKAIERQLQAERERLEKMTQRVQDANRQDLEAKKLLAQLEAAKVRITPPPQHTHTQMHTHTFHHSSLPLSCSANCFLILLFLHDFVSFTHICLSIFMTVFLYTCLFMP